MTRFLTIGALLLSSATLSAAEKPTPQFDRTAVVLAVPAVVPGGPIDSAFFRRDLRQAVRNHLAGFLDYRGDAYRLVTTDDRLGTLEAVRSAATGEFTDAVLLRVEGEQSDEQMLRTDSHRRRYYTLTRGCLDMTLTVVRLKPKGTGWRIVDSTTFRERSHTVTAPDGSRNCEDYEQVVQRAIDRSFGPATAGAVPGTATVAALPTILYIPREMLLDSIITPDGARALLRCAGAPLERQFGVRLEVAGIKILPYRFGLGGSIRESQRRMRRYLGDDSDTLRVVLNHQLTADESKSNQRRDELGLSHLGRRLVVVNLLPRISPEDTVWYSVANGLTILHEIGHTLGAIHVSDINSVMTHFATWVGADRLDPVNDQIVRAALGGRLTFDDPATYLAFVSTVLAGTAYNLADYPAFFFEYLDYPGNRRLRDTLRAAIGRQSYLRAADGYGLLVLGNRKKAAGLLRRALGDDPHQASLYYYLAGATDGAESADASRTATRMGYLMALDEGERVGRAEVDFGDQ